MIALAVIGAKSDSSGFREACAAGAKTIPAYQAFLGVCYATINSLDHRLAIALGLMAWLGVTMVILLVVRT